MKLLVLTFDFPPFLGGKSTVLKNVFERTDFDKTIITVTGKNSKDYDKKSKFNIIRIPKILFNIPMPIFRIYFLKVLFLFLVSVFYLIKFKPDHIIIGQLLSEGAAAYYLKKFFGINYSLFVYDTIDGEAPFYSRDKKIAKKILQNAFKIFFISNFMEKKLLQFGAVEKQLELVYPTADHKKFYPIKNTKEFRKKLKAEHKVILTVSRIVERKGIGRIIRLMPSLSKKLPGIKYVVVGNGPKKHEFEELAKKLNVSESVIFTGFVPEKNLLSYYNLCDVFAMPSAFIKDKFISEGFGIVFLEANACEKPVIGANNAGMPDAIVDGQTGILLKTESQKELERALLKVLTNESFARKLGKQGRKRIEKDVNWKKFVKKFETAISGAELK